MVRATHIVPSLAFGLFLVPSLVEAHHGSAPPALVPDAPFSVSIAPAADRKGVLVDVRTVVNAPIADVERVVANVDSYPDWIPSMTTARTHAANVGVAPADAGSVAFTTVVHLPWPLRDVREELVMKRSARTAGGNSGRSVGGGATEIEYAWHQVRGDLRINQGRWLLESRAPTQTEVRYQATFQLRSWIPMFLIRMAEQRQAPKLMNNLRARVAALRISLVHPPAPSVAATTL